MEPNRGKYIAKQSKVWSQLEESMEPNMGSMEPIKGKFKAKWRKIWYQAKEGMEQKR